MRFTYESYERLLKCLIEKRYCITDYTTWENSDKTVILRHDIDNNLEKAVHFSEIEQNVCGGNAIYFVLLTSNFYNVQSKKSRKIVRKIIQNGGIIGLHFDETQYDESAADDLEQRIIKECNVLSEIIDYDVKCVSMHRPSLGLLEMDLKITGIANSYSNTFFKEMKYVSDSRRNWHEDIENIVESEMYNRLHILTHPFWYSEIEDFSIRQTIERELWLQPLRFYDEMANNIRNMEKIIERAEIERRIPK